MSRVWEDPRVAEGLPQMLAARRRMIDDGATPIGWKVGFGAPGSLELMRIDGPVMGFMTERTSVASGAEVSMSDWTRPVVEFEVAVYLASDLSGGVTPDEARQAVASLGPAIELADIDLPIEASQVTEIVAGNIFHEAVVLGAPDPARSGIDTSGLTARILVDGVEHAVVTELEALTGRYPEVVATVANTLASAGEVLRAGDLIITGSVIPPLDGMSGREFVFSLEPFAPISVRRR